ncbi:MAG: hypothetical protein U0822_16345 [Anaerolineae bacterium]
MYRLLGNDRTQRMARVLDLVCILAWAGAPFVAGNITFLPWYTVPLPVIAITVIAACLVPWRWERVGGALMVVVGVIAGGMTFLGQVFMFTMFGHYLSTGELSAHWQDIAIFLGLAFGVPLLVAVPPIVAGALFLRHAAQTTAPSGDWRGPLARAIDVAGILIWASVLLALLASISSVMRSLMPANMPLWFLLQWWAETPFVAHIPLPALAAVSFIAAGLAAWRWERVGGVILVVLGLLASAAAFCIVVLPVWVGAASYGWSVFEADAVYLIWLVLAVMWASFLAVPPIADGLLFIRHATKLAAPPAAT